MKKSKPEIEFRCTYCGNDRMLDLGDTIVCDVETKSMLALKCKGKWPKKDAWRVCVLVRRFVSKLDYEFYEQLPAVQAERDEAAGRS